MATGKKFWTMVMVASFTGGSLLVVPAAAEPCSRPHETQATRTFEVRVSTAQDVYVVGETIRFRVGVTRTIDGVVVGPAEDAQVAIAVGIEDTFLYGGGTTDARGRALVKLRLKKNTPAGSADVVAFAYRETVDLPCHSDLEQETGDVEERNLFRVVR